MLDLVVGVLWFCVFTTLVATGIGLLITLLGLPILAGAFYLARAGAQVERRRVRTLLASEIAAPVRKPTKSQGRWHTLIAPFADATTWKELFYLWLVQPVQGLFNFCVAITAWSIPIWALTLPFYATRTRVQIWSGNYIDTWVEILPIAIGGLLVLPLAPWVIRSVASADAAVARWGLGSAYLRRARRASAGAAP